MFLKCDQISFEFISVDADGRFVFFSVTGDEAGTSMDRVSAEISVGHVLEETSMDLVLVVTWNVHVLVVRDAEDDHYGHESGMDCGADVMVHCGANGMVHGLWQVS